MPTTHERAGAGHAARSAVTRVGKPLHRSPGVQPGTPSTTSILAVVEFPTARETAEAAVRLAGELDARLLFVSV